MPAFDARIERLVDPQRQRRGQVLVETLSTRLRLHAPAESEIEAAESRDEVELSRYFCPSQWPRRLRRFSTRSALQRSPSLDFSEGKWACPSCQVDSKVSKVDKALERLADKGLVRS
jgi:hypothetical protein